MLGVSFEAVHDEIDSWCFLAAISKFFILYVVVVVVVGKHRVEICKASFLFVLSINTRNPTC